MEKSLPVPAHPFFPDQRTRGDIDPSVKRLTTPVSNDNKYMSSWTPTTEVEFRILDFEIVQ